MQRSALVEAARVRASHRIREHEEGKGGREGGGEGNETHEETCWRSEIKDQIRLLHFTSVGKITFYTNSPNLKHFTQTHPISIKYVSTTL